MQLTTEAKGTISFSIMLVFALLWLAVSPVFDAPWEPWEPLAPLMSGLAVPIINQFYRPLLLPLTGLAVFFVWEGRRSGYLLALLVALVAVAFTLVISFGNLMNRTWMGAFTTISAAIPALLAGWYAYHGYRRPGRTEV
ncbi:MAG: hypothetical protein M3N51_06245 [Actinomycetota bacterium]|nr:hypothetical protein [Actinomycetota bacterium]